MSWQDFPFSGLIGRTFTGIVVSSGKDMITFQTADEQFEMCHNQSCCESVLVEDIAGDLNDLIGHPVLLAEKTTNHDNQKLPVKWNSDSHTWTFYKISTIKGSVTIRWYGSSNGCYSETVDFGRVTV